MAGMSPDHKAAPHRWLPAQAERTKLTKDFENKFANPNVAAEVGYVDEVIEPATTRKRLIDSLEMLKNKRDFNPPKKHGNIPL